MSQAAWRCYLLLRISFDRTLSAKNLACNQQLLLLLLTFLQFKRKQRLPKPPAVISECVTEIILNSFSSLKVYIYAWNLQAVHIIYPFIQLHCNIKLLLTTFV